MVEVAVIGFGTVGSGVVEILDKNQKQIERAVPGGVHVKYIVDIREFPGNPYESLVVHDIQQVLDDPDIRIVWRIVVHGYGHMTDIERIRTNLIDDGDAELLKYFTDVKYIDMGHRKKLTNWEFLRYMPHLQVLIVSITDFSDRDLWYLTECPELEFLEMASCHVTDLTPLAQCKSLEHLCIGNLQGLTDISPLYGLTGLKRLRISQDHVPQSQKDEITRLLPDCQMLFAPGHWGFAGYWRYDDEGKCVERYALLREQFDYDDYPWAGWAW